MLLNGWERGRGGADTLPRRALIVRAADPLKFWTMFAAGREREGRGGGEAGLT